MPRLSKIRIVGAHYDKCRKAHGNTIIDLTKNDIAEHALFTLENGCGKGVILQLISQLLLPDESFGKNDGNTILKMFYKDNGELLNYTFHVALEFMLENNNETITLGVAFTAERKYDEDNEETAKLRYFHYILSPGKKSFINISSLPMFENGKSKDYGEYKKFINENKDIILYHKSKTDRSNSSYYQYLASYNIHQDDWKLYKRINKSEGGVSDYFKKAKDNKALFDKLIIPTIEESLNSEYSSDDSLIEIFKSDIGVTKNLPILLEREEDYKELIDFIIPFSAALDEYIRYNILYNNKLNLGKDYYITMKDFESSLLNEIDKWKYEKEKNKNDISNCKFQLDSLKISRIKNKINDLEKDLELKKESKQSKEKIEFEIRNEIEKLEINKLLIPREEKLVKIKKLESEKKKLIQLSEKDNLKNKLLNLEKSIQSEFLNEKVKINNFFDNHFAYLNYLDITIDNNKKNKMKVNKDLEDVMKSINKFELKEEELNEKYNKLLEKFNAFSLSVPDKLLEDNELIIKEINEKIQGNKKEIITFEKKLIEINNNTLNLVKDNEFNRKNLEKLKLEKMNAKAKEMEINNGIYSILNKDLSIIDKNTLLRIKEELIDLKNNKLDKIKDINKEIWKLQLDNSINKFNFWIPNHDILKIKGKIEKLNISVFTGSEYLFLENDAERERLLNCFPLLPFGLVIVEDQIDYIMKNIKLDILRSQVPIFIRSKMNINEELSFSILRNENTEKLLNTNEFNLWLSNLDKYEKENYKNISIVNEKVKTIINLISLIDIKVETRFYYDIKKDMINKSDEIEKIVQLIDKNKTEENKMQNNLKILENAIVKSELEFTLISEKNLELSDYISLKNIIDIDRNKYNINIKIKDKLYERKNEIENDILSFKDNIRSSSTEFNTVKHEIINNLQNVNKIINIDDINIFESNKVISNKPKYDFLNTVLCEDINIRSEILNELDQKDNKLFKITIEVNSLKEYIKEKENELFLLNEDWHKYEMINISFAELLKEIKSVNKKLKNVMDDIVFDRESISGIEAKLSLNKKNEDILNEEIILNYKMPPEFYLQQDLKNLEYKFKKEKLELSKYTKVINENIERKNNSYFNLNALIKSIYDKFDGVIKGKINKNLRDKNINGIESDINIWKNELKEINIKLVKSKNNLEDEKNKFDSKVAASIKEEGLKDRVLEIVKGMKIDEYNDIMDILKSLEEGFKASINKLEKDKEEKNEICRKWANRAAGYIVKISEAIRNMMKSMIYINENNYSFPLVKLEDDKKLKLEKDDTLIYIMEKFYVEAIKNIVENEEFDDIRDVSARTIRKYLSTEKIFAFALNGVYPKLLVYKMTEKNEFRYSEPKSRYYDTWEGIHLGEGISAEGSGGQTLSISTFVLMMLLNQKRTLFYDDNLSNIIIMDNPFSNASSAHVLDPVFEIAGQLNFQIIAFAPPELIKEEISERFPVLWDLRLEERSNTNVSFITGEIKYGGRKRK